VQASPSEDRRGLRAHQPAEQRHRGGQPGYSSLSVRSGLGKRLRSPSSRRREDHNGDIGRANESPAGAGAGAVGELVGIDGGVVSGVINLESSGVEASDWRPRHDERYHET
jgi:hypothetical protein